MRITKAYHGKYIAYRAWFNGKLIWNYGDDTMGDLVAALNTAAKPEPEVPDAILLQGEANTQGTGLAEVWELDPVLARTGAEIIPNVMPRAAETVHPMAAGVINGRATARPYTYGTVFTRGHAPAELSTQAKPNAAEAVRAVGVADFGSIDVASRPRPEEVPRILAAADATIDAPALPVPQEPECVVLKTATGLTSYAGADTAPVHKVTFMYAGKVLHSSSAIHGYGCTDPLTTGDVEKQVKGMTVSHTFEHTGWSLTEDGDPDASVLENITEDIVVYAAFTASIRYYDVRFWDGEKLVDTVSTPYGGTAVTSYKKLGYTVTWVPSNENITGETDCFGKFTEISFADATWDEIAEIAESGNAASIFAVGEEKTVNLKLELSSGSFSVEPVTFVIAGFNNGLLEDKTTGHITLVAKHALSTKRAIQSTYKTYVNYETSELNTWLDENLYDALPAALRNVVKSKYIGRNGPNNWTDMAANSSKCWLLSLEELGLSKTNFGGYGTALPLFTSDSSRIRKLGASGAATTYLTRNYYQSGSSTYFAYITAAGAVYGGSGSSGYGTTSTKYGVVFGIVI